MSTQICRFVVVQRISSLVMGLLLVLVMAPVHAADLRLTARFAPSALDPNHRKFQNTTPPSGICVRWGICRSGQFSISTPLSVSDRAMGGGEITDRRKWYYMAVDAGWREVHVIHESGSDHTVRFRISMLAMRFSRNNSGSPGIYGSSSGGCSRLGPDIGSGTWHAWGWILPERAVDCARKPGHSTEASIRVTEVSIGYELDTPDPLAMYDGEYTGTTSYSVGEGSDIDLGAGTHNDDELNIHFTLTVAHDFEVRFPADSPRVQLAPEGGWRQWTDHGIEPASLRQELPFVLTSSMDFSLKTRCEHEVEGRCGIRNPVTNTTVPIDVDATIPGVTNTRDGRPAQFTPLLPDDARAPRFAPDGYVMSRRSTLRFATGRDATRQMLQESGSQWAGDITLVFDANP